MRSHLAGDGSMAQKEKWKRYDEGMDDALKGMNYAK